VATIRQVTDAIVLSTADSREDKIVTFLSPELGRVAAIARHGRKSIRRFAGHVEPITLAEFTIKQRPDRDLGLLERAHAKEAFGVIKADLTRYALATTMAEVVLHLIPVHGREPGAYHLLLKALSHLNRRDNRANEELLLLFEMKMLLEGGFLPQVQEIHSIPHTARLILQGWLDGHWSSLEDEDRPLVVLVLETMIQEVSGRPLKSRAFLNEMLDSQKTSA
jgi:recombinational DNA repair protein (RecF pathway)